MINKKSFGEQLFCIANTFFMVFVIVITLYPFLFVIFASLSDAREFVSHNGPLLFPLKPTLVAYKRVFQNILILTSYRNTIFIVVAGVSLNILMTSLGAYFLSRKNVLWKNAIMIMIIITMYFNGGLIPNYLNIKSLGLYNSFSALILPVAVSTFNLIIMRTAFASIPYSLEESALLDGARHINILFRIVLPLSMPTVSVLILYYGIGHWNSWFSAMIYIKDRSKLPLQMILREILILNETSSMQGGDTIGELAFMQHTIKHATIVVATLPFLMIYPFLQKYFIKGVMIGALKG